MLYANTWPITISSKPLLKVIIIAIIIKNLWNISSLKYKPELPIYFNKFKFNMLIGNVIPIKHSNLIYWTEGTHFSVNKKIIRDFAQINKPIDINF